MNLYIQIFYPTLGPTNAFYLWWSVFVFENLGKIFKILKQVWLKLHNLASRLLCNVVIVYKAAKNPEFLGYKGKAFPGWYTTQAQISALRVYSESTQRALVEHTESTNRALREHK